MGVGVAEEGLDCGRPKRVVTAGNDLVQVDEADVFLLGNLPRPSAVAVGVADDLTVLPGLARDRRTDDGDCAFGPGVLDVLAQIPAVGVDRLVNLEDGVIDLFGLPTGRG